MSDCVEYARVNRVPIRYNNIYATAHDGIIRSTPRISAVYHRHLCRSSRERSDFGGPAK